MALLYTNNASSTLAVTLASDANTLVVQGSDGALFPSLSGGNEYILTIEDAAGNIEICRCTARSADTMTIVRAQEGTTAREFLAGARVELRLTAGVLTAFAQTSQFAAVNLEAGAGLTGGGNLTASRTFAVGTGTGISVAADSVGLDIANTRNVDHATVSVSTGAGLTGGGNLTATRTISLDVGALPAADPNDFTAATSFLLQTSGSHKQARVDGIVNQVVTASTKTLAATDNQTVAYNNSATAYNVTLPSDATAPFPVGGEYGVICRAAGKVTFLAGSEATVTSLRGLRVRANGGMAVAFKVAPNTWVVGGDTEAAT
jgi:hypothetical protein